MLTFTASADGSPAPTFQWMKDGVAIPGATAATFVISSANSTHNGVYNAVASNSFGWALSDDLILTVQSTLIAPSFTVQPYPAASAPAGSSLTLSATAVGTPTPTYQWRKNGTAISGATNSTLYFPSLATSDSGTYSVIASNSAGIVKSSNSVLTVTSVDAASSSLPVFTLQPVSMSAARRETVTFQSLASGVPAPTYQWFKNGVAISGATTANYTIRSAAPAHSGTYYVTATNAVGTAISQEAVLSVAR
jgi:hypothetical protein